MTEPTRRKPIVRIVAALAILFGVMTLFSGGAALFGETSVRALFGDVVGLVLWFNFLSGFAYVLAGLGLLAGRHWSVWLSAVIALAIVVVFVVFGLHVAAGGAYEMRTVGAMTVRLAFWLAVTLVAARQIGWRQAA